MNKEQALSAKAETAVKHGAPITHENLRRLWGPDIVVQGEPGKTGVIICSPNGNPKAVYRHPDWVLDHTGNKLGATPTPEQFDPWRWELHPPETSQKHALEYLALLKNSQQHPGLRIALELEGTGYDSQGDLVSVSHPKHPELNTCTHERSTPPCESINELARQASQQILGFYQEHPKLSLQLASVPQAGDIDDIVPNPHPYLRVAMPKAASLVTSIHPRAEKILSPMAKNIGVTVKALYEIYQLRLWPNSALHIHVEAALDPNTGHIDGTLEMQRLNCYYSLASLAISLLDASTVHLLNTSLPVRDVRHSLRRLLPTANNGRPYPTYIESLNPWKDQYISGAISAASRYPWDDQHGIARPRTEYGTIEYTNTGTHPHLGVNLAIAAAARTISLIGIESVSKSPNTTVFDYAVKEYGHILAPINPEETILAETAFDQHGWEGKTRLNGREYRLSDLARQTARVLLTIGQKYPAYEAETRMAAGYLMAACQPPARSILDYFDPDSPQFARGCLSDIKHSSWTGNLWEHISGESQYSRAQALIGLAKPSVFTTPPSIMSLLPSL